MPVKPQGPLEAGLETPGAAVQLHIPPASDPASCPVQHPAQLFPRTTSLDLWYARLSPLPVDWQWAQQGKTLLGTPSYFFV